MKRQKKIRVIVYPGICRRVAVAIWRAAHRLQPIIRPTHTIRVHVVPGEVVEGEQGECGFGAFHPDTLDVFIAGQWPKPFYSWDEWTAEQAFIESLPATLAHELVHYQQWRDGRPFCEDEAYERMYELAMEVGL